MYTRAWTNLKMTQLITAVTMIMMSIIATTPAPMTIPFVCPCASCSPDLSDVSETDCPGDEMICSIVDVCVTVLISACETVCVGVNKVLVATSEQDVADGS